MQVYQTSPLRVTRPAPMPSAALWKPSAKTVALSALPAPVVSSIRRMRSCVDAVVLEVVAELALQHGDAVGDGAAGEVVVEPVHVAADVGDAVVEAEGLGDVEAVLLIEGEADGVGDQRLGGPEIDLEAGRDLDAFLGLHPLVGGGGDFRLVGLFGGDGRGRREQAGAGGAEENGGGEQEFSCAWQPGSCGERLRRGVGQRAGGRRAMI